MSSVAMSTPISFREFLVRKERDVVTTTVLGMACAFFLYKLLYLDPDFSQESYAAVRAASYGGARVDAYAWFLRGARALHFHPYILVFLQYTLLQASCLWFVLTLLYIYQLPGRASRFLFFFLAINPLTLYVANYIGSESLSAALSVTWITIMIHLLRNSKAVHWIVQGVLLALLYTMQPFIAIGFLCLLMLGIVKIRVSAWLKLLSLAITIAASVWAIGVKPLHSMISFTPGIPLPQVGHFQKYAMGRELMNYNSWRWFKVKGPQLECHWYNGGKYLLWIFPLCWLVLYIVVVVLLVKRLKMKEAIVASVQSSVFWGLLIVLVFHLLCNLLYAPVWIGTQLPVFLIALAVVLCDVPWRKPVCS